jgi:hypothetical protein
VVSSTLAGHHGGLLVSFHVVPGDKTAPVGTFTTTPAKAWQALTTVSVTQTSLSDDFSAAADVLRWVNWGDGSAVEAWTAGWFFFKASSKTWAKAATKGKAWKRAKAAVVVPTAKGDWVVRLSALRKGTLFLRPSAADLAGNLSKPVTQKAVLTVA